MELPGRCGIAHTLLILRLAKGWGMRSGERGTDYGSGHVGKEGLCEGVGRSMLEGEVSSGSVRWGRCASCPP